MKTSRLALLVLAALAASLVAAPSASAQIVANPQAVQFGKQARNTTSTPRAFQLFNPPGPGSSPRSIPNDVTVPPFTFDGPGDGATTVIVPGQTVTVVVTFRPTALGQVVRTVNYSGTQVAAIGTGTAKNEIDGTDGDDRLTGTPGDDLITCGKGNDRVNGGGGNDVIKCGDGNDIISGGNGDDVISGGDGNDIIKKGNGNDRIDGGAGNDRVGGGAGNDRIKGGAGNDHLLGNSGDDRLFGGAGRDFLRGGPGRDRLVGGPGTDTVFQ
jgi:Ca2+-binding RTX toxin-like protein